MRAATDPLVKVGLRVKGRLSGGLMPGLAVVALYIGLMAATPLTASASPQYLTAFLKRYPAAASTQLNSCRVCRTAAIPALNSYGRAFKSHNHSFRAIGKLDSDKDGSTNLQEIMAGTWPGVPGK